jgi:hypothetical protein
MKQFYRLFNFGRKQPTEVSESRKENLDDVTKAKMFAEHRGLLNPPIVSSPLVEASHVSDTANTPLSPPPPPLQRQITLHLFSFKTPIFYIFYGINIKIVFYLI